MRCRFIRSDTQDRPPPVAPLETGRGGPYLGQFSFIYSPVLLWSSAYINR